MSNGVEQARSEFLTAMNTYSNCILPYMREIQQTWVVDELLKYGTNLQI